MNRVCVALAAVVASLTGICFGETLKNGDLVGVIGDSITEQKQYSVFIEDYLLMCKPQADLRVTQFGWSGETSWGFAGRMANDMLPFNVNAVTTCFGMNDGGYGPMDDGKAKHYHDGQTSIVEQLKKANVRFIVVGSPGCVDSFAYHKGKPEEAEVYNKTLAAERDIARQVAAEQGVSFADVYSPMVDVMTKAKAKYGKEYHVAGGDGVHPSANGQLVMAYAFLKGLGCNGDVGTITFDLTGNKAEATEGHKVLSAGNGSAEIESSRYPFCFFGDPKSTDSTRGIIEFLPFNEELNRFRLVVTGLKTERAKITWGGQSREFPAADLAKGINLAAEFADNNPFGDAFRRVDQQVREQQNFETPLVKQWRHGLLNKDISPQEKQSLEQMVAAGMPMDKALRDAAALSVKPVKHTIKVEPAGAVVEMRPALPDNTPPQGFIAAFNGKDLTGWKGLVSPDGGPPARAKMTPEQLKEAQAKADQRMNEHWKAEEGVIVYDGHGDSLCTAKDYGDFEMFVDWKIEKNGDSGIYLRGSPQVQIWDPDNGPARGVGSGGLYNNQKPENSHDPLTRADNPVGQWNRFHILMIGDRVTVYLNGKLVVNNVVLENYWERDKPIYPTGQIELQNHSSKLYFKNVYLREIPRE